MINHLHRKNDNKTFYKKKKLITIFKKSLQEYIILASWTGIEPASVEPESTALSIRPPGQENTELN